MADFRIYVACLASYNNGRLHGRWIDCDGKDADELQEEVNAILRSSPYPNVTVEHEGREVPSAEEFAIHDHEGFPRNSVEEYTPLSDIAEMVEALETLEDHQLVGFRFLLANDSTTTVAEAVEKADDVQWSEESPKDAVATFYDETGQTDGLPEWVQNHVDWESLARDWEASGSLTTFDDPNKGRVTILNADAL